MDKYFRREDKKLVEVIQYSLDQIKNNPGVKIHIGCDSQVFGPIISYALTIVYRNGTKGGHYIYKRIKKDRPPRNIPKEVQVHERLMEEVYMTMELAQYLQDNSSIKIEAVEFDFNEEESFLSNKLTNMATGWAKGMGFNARIKPEELIACRAANHICRL